MEDSSEQQQWSWALAVGTVFALYGVCSLYNWFATILGNIRFRPRPQSPLAADAAPATHPSKLTLPTFWVFGAGGLVRPRRGEIPYKQHHQPACDVRFACRRPSREASIPGDGHHQSHPRHQPLRGPQAQALGGRTDFGRPKNPSPTR